MTSKSRCQFNECVFHNFAHLLSELRINVHNYVCNCLQENTMKMTTKYEWHLVTNHGVNETLVFVIKLSIKD